MQDRNGNFLIIRITTKSKRVILSLAISLVPGLMVLALITPVIGPAIDHHYVDRSPAHSHIFTGNYIQDHEHFLTAHDHTELDFESFGDGTSILSTSINSSYAIGSFDGAALEMLHPTFIVQTVVVYQVDISPPDDDAVLPLYRPPRTVS